MNKLLIILLFFSLNLKGQDFFWSHSTVSITLTEGLNEQLINYGDSITSIKYKTTGVSGVTFDGFPSGVITDWTAGIVTISGTPSEIGEFNYTVTAGNKTVTGTISVQNYITADPYEVYSTSATQTKYVSIESNYSDLSFDDSEAWISVSGDGSSGNVTLTVILDENTTGSFRAGLIYVYSGVDQILGIAVYQE
jgi:hypothetical protein